MLHQLSDIPPNPDQQHNLPPTPDSNSATYLPPQTAAHPPTSHSRQQLIHLPPTPDSRSTTYLPPQTAAQQPTSHPRPAAQPLTSHPQTAVQQPTSHYRQQLNNLPPTPDSSSTTYLPPQTSSLTTYLPPQTAAQQPTSHPRPAAQPLTSHPRQQLNNLPPTPDSSSTTYLPHQTSNSTAYHPTYLPPTPDQQQNPQRPGLLRCWREWSSCLPVPQQRISQLSCGSLGWNSPTFCQHLSKSCVARSAKYIYHNYLVGFSAETVPHSVNTYQSSVLDNESWKLDHIHLVVLYAVNVCESYMLGNQPCVLQLSCWSLGWKSPTFLQHLSKLYAGQWAMYITPTLRVYWL